MRVIIGCLAVIGLAVVVLVVGCVGLAGVAIAFSEGVPPYATREEIQRRHASDLALIQRAIRSQDYSQLQERLSPVVLAIYHKDAELLRRHVISGKSHLIVNDGGVGTLTAKGRTVDCEVIALQASDAPFDDYLVFFVDQQKASSPDTPVERP